MQKQAKPLSTEYIKFKNLKIDTTPIGFSIEKNRPYFCTPIGATILGWDNGIHYCFIDGFDEMVFAVNPETLCEHYVYPLSKNFSDFLSLLASVKNTNTLQQIILWNKQEYTNFITSKEEKDYCSRPEVIKVLKQLQSELSVNEMAKPFEYVKELQSNFQYSKIRFSDEFYNVTGIEKP